jgi:hypothetical protein
VTEGQVSVGFVIDKWKESRRGLEREQEQGEEEQEQMNNPPLSAELQLQARRISTCTTIPLFAFINCPRTVKEQAYSLTQQLSFLQQI